MTPITYVLTDNSATGTPAPELPQPLLGLKNPNGSGAFLSSVLMVNGAAGAQLLETVTDATVIGGESPSTRRLLPTMSRLTAYEPLANEMLSLGIVLPGDGQTDAMNLLAVSSWPLLFNGTTYDQARELSAANLSAAVSSAGGAIAAGPGQWAIQHSPAADTQATITRAAGGAGVRHVCTGVQAFLTGTGAANGIAVNLRDGASGAGTILWSGRLFNDVNLPRTSIELTGLNIVGSANTAMTLEFAAAPAGGAIGSVSLQGYDAN